MCVYFFFVQVERKIADPKEGKKGKAKGVGAVSLRCLPSKYSRSCRAGCARERKRERGRQREKAIRPRTADTARVPLFVRPNKILLYQIPPPLSSSSYSSRSPPSRCTSLSLSRILRFVPVYVTKTYNHIMRPYKYRYVCSSACT